MKSFDLYEFSALILPGVIILYGLALLYPELNLIVQNKEFTVGDLGLFVILAYAAAHIIQGFGNIIEGIWWKLSGKPTDWIRIGKNNLLSPIQIKQLEKDLPLKLGINNKKAIKISKSMKESDWYGITRQIYASVSAGGRSQRVDIFNANYGLCRGITSSLLILSVVSFMKLGMNYWALALLLLFLAIVMFFRMKRFGIHYARELFIQFIQLPK